MQNASLNGLLAAYCFTHILSRVADHYRIITYIIEHIAANTNEAVVSDFDIANN